MKKRLIGMAMAAVLAMTALTGCGTTEDTSSLDSLTFTHVTSPLNLPSIVEKEEGIFTKAFADDGIEVKYAEITSGADQTQALAAGNDADIKVLNMYSRSPKAFCMYSKDESISSPADLRGKTIAGPVGTNLHELLAAYLATADMTVDDVNFVNMGIPEAKAGLEGGSVDVALLAGAAAYQTQQQGYHLITDGEGLINAIIAVAVTNKFYEAHPEIIEKLQSAQAEIADFMQNHEQEAYEMAAAELDLDVDAVKEMAQYYDFSTEITAVDKDGFQRTADFMYQAGMIEKELDVNTLF